jgi:uncharacterized protein
MSEASTGSFKAIWREALAPLDRASAWLMLCAVCMPVVYWYQGRPGFYEQHIPALTDALPTVQAQLWRFVAAFTLFFVVPALGWRLLSGRPLAGLGVRLGDWRLGLKLALVAVLVASPGLWISAASPEMQRTYPMAVEAPTGPALFMLYELAYALYYWGWEFFFRGALQLGLMSALGFSGAMMTQWLPSVLIHFEKPLAETWGAVLVGPLLGMAAVRTRSCLYVFLFHYAIGVINDVFCATRQGMWG